MYQVTSGVAAVEKAFCDLRNKEVVGMVVFPLKIRFLAISTPNVSNPTINILAYYYFLIELLS